jgi:hypothetical protein
MMELQTCRLRTERTGMIAGRISGKMAGAIVSAVLLGMSAAAVALDSPMPRATPQQNTQNGAGQQQGQQQPCPAQKGQSNSSKQANGAGKSSGNSSSGANAKPCNNKPAPLFGGALSIKQSHQSTDSTALGFNGVDPNGQVQKAFVDASPSSDSQQKAQDMTSYRPSAAELAKFQHDGGLPVATPPPNPGQQ